MNLLKKMNRGFIAFAIVTIIIIGYLIFHSIILEAKKPEIMAATKKYIDVYKEYVTFNPNLGDGENEITENAIKNMYSSLNQKIADMYTNSTTADAQVQVLVVQAFSNIMNNVDATDLIITESDSDSIRYTFKSDDMVTVQYNVNMLMKYTDANGVEREYKQDYVTFTLTLLYENNNWKIAYSNNNFYSGGDILVR